MPYEQRHTGANASNRKGKRNADSAFRFGVEASFYRFKAFALGHGHHTDCDLIPFSVGQPPPMDGSHRDGTTHAIGLKCPTRTLHVPHQDLTPYGTGNCQAFRPKTPRCADFRRGLPGVSPRASLRSFPRPSVSDLEIRRVSRQNRLRLGIGLPEARHATALPGPTATSGRTWEPSHPRLLPLIPSAMCMPPEKRVPSGMAKPSARLGHPPPPSTAPHPFHKVKSPQVLRVIHARRPISPANGTASRGSGKNRGHPPVNREQDWRKGNAAGHAVERRPCRGSAFRASSGDWPQVPGNPP